MRVLILGGTLFIGRRIALELLARGDDVMVVHRGQTEPAELSGCAHVHAARDALAGVADQLRAFRPDAVIDTRAMTRAHADAVLPHLPDAHLVLLSSIDVYRAYELLLAGRGGEPVPLTETSPVRSARYPLRDLLPGLGEHYDKLDVEPLYLSRGGCVLRLSLIYGEHDGQQREEFVLRRVRAGRMRIPFGPGTSLDTRCYVGDVASAVPARRHRWSPCPRTSCPRTWRAPGASPSTSWSTAARRPPCSAGVPPIRPKPSRCRSGGTWSIRRLRCMKTFRLTTAP
jgi:nucleoside-diphosphate-sugar epimerase